MKSTQSHLGLLQFREEFLVRGQRADGIVDHVNAHPARRRLLQQAAQLVIAFHRLLEDEALHEDVAARLGNGGKHGFIGARAILEQFHAIAGEQWRGAQVAHGGQVIVQQRGIAGGGQLARGAQAGRTADDAFRANQVDGSAGS